MSEAKITVAGGGDPKTIILSIEDFEPTEGDLVFAAQLQRSRILQRTERGVDYLEKPFKPYNATRPFYYYPNGPVGKEREKSRLSKDKAAVKRFAAKLGRRKSAISPSGLGIRFDSYRDFKQTYLERQNVDLRGPRSPHMLQQMVIKSGGTQVGERNQHIGLDANKTPAREFVIGIYGEAAARASANNETREFLNSNPDDNLRITQAIVSRTAERARKQLRGQ